MPEFQLIVEREAYESTTARRKLKENPSDVAIRS